MAGYTPTPPGWYPDPERPGRRFWDGAAWTEHRQAPPQPPGPRTPEQRRAVRRRWLIALAVVASLGALYGIGVASGLIKPADDTLSQTTLNGYAQVACEKAAMVQLRSPSTAKFPTYATVTSTGANTFDVADYVDSQNSFGGIVRSSVHCTVTRLPETKQWRVETVTVR